MRQPATAQYVINIPNAPIWGFPVDDGLVLARSDLYGLFFLNPTARLLWSELRRGESPSSAAQSFAAHFSVEPSQAASDIELTLADWERGLLAPSSAEVLYTPEPPDPVKLDRLDCVVNGHRIRVFLERGEVTDEIAPRLDPVLAPRGDYSLTFVVFINNEKFYVLRDGVQVGSEETSSGARAILLQAMSTADEPSAILHAGSCGGILLAGGSHSGKSTLSASLMGAGWPYHSDDSAVLDRDFKIQPMPFALMLRPGSWPLMEAKYPAFRDAPTFHRWGTDVRFLPPEAVSAPVSARALVFVDFQRDESPQLRSLSVFESLLELHRSGFWVQHTEERIGAFLAWLAGVGRYSLRFNSVETAEAFLRNI